MIEIKSVRDLETDHRVSVPYNELIELLECKKKSIELYGKLKLMVTERYVENFACFGNGGAITYEELAELLSVELPKVPYMGMDKYLTLKREINDAEEKETVV